MPSLNTRDFQIQGILDREHAIAKEHLASGRKDRALVALRRRKYQESLLGKTDQQLENLEQLVREPPFVPVCCVECVLTNASVDRKGVHH